MNLWVYASVNIGRENDRSAGVGELRGKLSEAVAAFDSSKARIRELDSRLQGLEDPTALQLQDVERKLARFEEAGHTAILTAYRQRQELDRQFGADEQAALKMRIRDLAQAKVSSDTGAPISSCSGKAGRLTTSVPIGCIVRRA